MTAQDCAKYFLTKPDRDAGDDITHLKLQKLCYYAQAWHLALFDTSLFPGRFEAWPHGPVCPDIWQAYRDRGAAPIEAPADFDVACVSEGDRSFLNDIWDVYGRYSAKYLEEMTHQEDPWLRARGGLPPGARCNTAISEESMRAYYAPLAQP